jgi:WD domain, G-beta repeat
MNMWWRGGRMRIHSTATKMPSALSPDSRWLALCRDEMVYLCDLRAERVVRCLLGATQTLLSVAFSPDARLLAAAGDDRLVRLWDVRTGTLLSTLDGHRGNVSQLAFAPTGKHLLSSSSDGTVLVWDVAEALKLPAPAVPADTRSLEALWADLASSDAGLAEKAQRELEQRPTALPFLARLMRPVRVVEPARLKKLIEDLDSGNPTDRDRASTDLERLGDQAVPILKKSLQSPSPEVRRRVERLLARLDRPTVTGADARAIRVVELLERLGSVPARKLLTELAGGAPESRLTREAESALRRLKRQ